MIGKRDIVLALAGLVLAGTSATALLGWHAERKKVAELESQVAELQKKEKESAVLRSVSTQMEEIAVQQKEISDEQREEAVEQRHVADEMRLRSEIERAKALKAQENAIASEQQAQLARLTAEDERLVAEHQRIKAEFSKRVADTLSYIALGRSLGSQSSAEAQAGNMELARLLAYASYQYVNRYGGDVYHPTVLEALMAASESKRIWTRHFGSVMGLTPVPGKENRLVSVSSYGEIMQHEKQGNQLSSRMLLADKTYDFRGVYVEEDGTIYAVSRTGHLVIVRNGVPKVLPVGNKDALMGIIRLNGDQLLLMGEHSLVLFDRKTNAVVDSRSFDCRLTALCEQEDSPVFFDDRGRQHLVRSWNEITVSNVPVKGCVTAFDNSSWNGMVAYGMDDGTIYLYNSADGSITKLTGHLSRITKLKLNRYRVISTSYDGTMKFWGFTSGKIEPVTLAFADAWFMNFCMDNTKRVAWIGDQKGVITETLTLVPDMLEIVRKNLTRDFTKEEWDYYIGKNIPFESFRNSDK